MEVLAQDERFAFLIRLVPSAQSFLLDVLRRSCNVLVSWQLARRIKAEFAKIWAGIPKFWPVRSALMCDLTCNPTGREHKLKEKHDV